MQRERCLPGVGLRAGHLVECPAAGSSGAFWGTDFNPSQAAYAGTLAAASQADISLFDDSFADFVGRDDLPVFDVIVLHGVWSWISEQNRAAIIEIIRKHLRVGGAVYISYNCQPGWAAQMPLRHLMSEHMRRSRSLGVGATGRIDAALSYAQRVADAGASYFACNPMLAPHLRHVTSQKRAYLAHEYFNRDWHVTTVADVADAMQQAKLSFVASARLLDHSDEYSLEPAARELLAEIDDPIFRQTVRDYVVNQKFRADIFVKGARDLLGIEAHRLWMQERFTLVVPAQATKLTHDTPMDEVVLDEQIYDPLIAAMAQDNYVAKTIAELREYSRLATFPVQHLMSALLMLTGLGYVQPAGEPGSVEREQCSALNRHPCARALASADVPVLASPVLGGGRHTSQDQQLIILAKQAGHSDPTDQARYLNGIFERHGAALNRDGKPIRLGDEAIGHFRRLAVKFEQEGHAPLLTALGIA